MTQSGLCQFLPTLIIFLPGRFAFEPSIGPQAWRSKIRPPEKRCSHLKNSRGYGVLYEYTGHFFLQCALHTAKCSNFNESSKYGTSGSHPPHANNTGGKNRFVWQRRLKTTDGQRFQMTVRLLGCSGVGYMGILTKLSCSKEK